MKSHGSLDLQVQLLKSSKLSKKQLLPIQSVFRDKLNSKGRDVYIPFNI